MAIELRDYQRDALQAVRRDWRAGMKRCLISLPTGTGKCNPRTSFVWSGGLREFGELFDEQATLIRAPEQMRPINGWHDDGVREGINVTTECGLECDGTPEHPLWVRTDDGFEGWRKLCELKGDEYVAVARGRADWGTIEIAEEDAYLLGLAVADGCFYRTTGGTVAFDVVKHPSVIDAVIPTAISWADRARGKESDRKNAVTTSKTLSPKSARFRIHVQNFDHWAKESFGVVLGPSETRLVPLSVLRGTRQTVANFLRGYFAGDGDVGIAVEVTSTSKRLLQQVQQLLLGLGVWAGLRPRKSVGQPAWRLSVRDTETFAREIGIGHPGTTKHENYERLLAKKRNTNVDVVPGVGTLIREMGQPIPAKYKRTDAWRQADAYYGTAKRPSYAMLEEFVRGAPDSPARQECVRILKDDYAWSKIASIEPSTCHRIDCEVDVEHAFIGNGLVNHNTWIFVFAIYSSRANGLRCLVLENTDELIDQSVAKLRKVGVDPGIIKGSKNEWSRDVVVASVQTLSRASRLYNLPPNHFGLVITDEAHYANALSYQRVLWYFADAWHLGVTATPFRGDKKSLAGAGWNQVSYVYTMQQAIRDKWLAPVRFERCNTGVELKALKKSNATLTSERDFNAKMLSKLINTPERNNAIVDAALAKLVVENGPFNKRLRRTIAFCADVDHSVCLANAFRRRGIEAWAIYGSLKPKMRAAIIKAHQMGRYPILTNCNILTTGYDDPQIEGIIMARPTESKVLYLQCLGRGLRLSPGKTDCVALDVVDVAKKHAMTIGPELIELEEALVEQGNTKDIAPPVTDTSALPGLLTPEAPPALGPAPSAEEIEAQMPGLVPKTEQT